MKCATKWGVSLGVLVAVTVALGAAAAPVQAAGKEELKAREAFAAGKYDDALELFAKLYAETLHPVYLRNIGRCYQKLQKPDQAIDKFREYLAKEKKVTPDERAEIDGYIKEMEDLKSAQARQAAQAQQPPATVAPIASAAPPTTGAPPPTWTPPPPAATGPSATLVSQPPPPEKESHFYTSWWFWTGVGVVVAGGVVAALLLSRGGTERPACPTGIMCAGGGT